jgi:hypothetical protein
MSHVNSPTTTLRSQVAEHRIVALSALLALLATAAVVLVLAIDGGSSSTSSVAPASHTAKTAQVPAVTGHAIGIPSPSAAGRAAAEGVPGLTTWQGRPDESRTAAAIAGN